MACGTSGAHGAGIDHAINKGSIAVQSVNNRMTGCYSGISTHR